MEALHIYTDGSYRRADRTMSYGWVLANPRPHHTPARAVTGVAEEKLSSASMLMESAALVDAICEFAHRRVPLHIYADNQGLAHHLELVRSGELPESFLLDAPKLIRSCDARRLLAVLSQVELTPAFASFV